MKKYVSRFRSRNGRSQLIWRLNLFFVSLFLAGCNHPVDTNLEQVFFANGADFDHLVRMAQEDRHVIRIAQDFTWLAKTSAWPRPESELGFSRERWEEYRRLFRKLGLTGGIVRSEDYPSVIFFMASGSGLATGGSEKGYAYSGDEPSPQLNSLDDAKRVHASVQTLHPAFKKLRDNWYLYYMWDD